MHQFSTIIIHYGLRVIILRAVILEQAGVWVLSPEQRSARRGGS